MLDFSLVSAVMIPEGDVLSIYEVTDSGDTLLWAKPVTDLSVIYYDSTYAAIIYYDDSLAAPGQNVTAFE